MAERQPMTSEQRKEIAKRRREKAAAAALEPELSKVFAANRAESFLEPAPGFVYSEKPFTSAEKRPSVWGI